MTSTLEASESCLMYNWAEIPRITSKNLLHKGKDISHSVSNKEICAFNVVHCKVLCRQFSSAAKFNGSAQEKHCSKLFINHQGPPYHIDIIVVEL